MDAWIEERRGGKPEVPATALGILAAALLLLTLANPYGFGLHIWITNLLLDPSRNISLDALPPFASEFAATPLAYSLHAAVAIIVVGFIAIRQRLSVGIAGAAVIGAFLLVRSPVLTPLCAALIFPFVARSLTAVSAYVPQAVRAARAIALFALLAMAGILFSGVHLRALGLASRVGIGIQRDAFPIEAAEAILTKKGFPDHMLNLGTDGGFLATRIRGRTIFCDTRGSLYGGAFYDLFARALLGDQQVASALHNSYHPGAILLGCAWPRAGDAARALTSRGQWALAYFDGVSAVFVRNTTDNLHFLRDRSLQKSGLARIENAKKEFAEKGGSIGAGNSARLIGAGHLFLGLGKFADAESIYLLLAEKSPSMHGAWLGLGIAQEQLGKHASAIANLQRASQLRSKDPLPLLWLNRALRSNGQLQEADEAQARARNLDAAATEAFLKIAP